MSNLGPFSGGGRAAQMIPTPPRGDTIARYPTYLEAQRAVDHLSDNGFPVQFVTIVGTGLRMVERVTGRLTYTIVAVRSILSGAYFGALVGLFLRVFADVDAIVILAGALFGAGFSLIFGVIAYSLTGGRRDFSSVSQVVATEYEVLCMPEQAGQARQLIGQLTEGRSGLVTAGQPARGGSSPYGPPPVAPPPYQPPPPGHQPHYSAQERSDRAAAGPGQPGPGELPEQPPVTGLTYGEVMERRRRERVEREAAERAAAAGTAPQGAPAPATAPAHGTPSEDGPADGQPGGGGPAEDPAPQRGGGSSPMQ